MSLGNLFHKVGPAIENEYIIIARQKAQFIFTFQLVKNNIQGLIKTIFVSIWWSIYHSNHNITKFVKHISINFYENWFKNIVRWM